MQTVSELVNDGAIRDYWFCHNYAEDQFTYLLQVWDELNRLATEDLVTVKKVQHLSDLKAHVMSTSDPDDKC